MSDTERKGDPPTLDHENGNGLATTAQGRYDSAEDVFGNEEGAQVRREEKNTIRMRLAPAEL